MFQEKINISIPGVFMLPTQWITKSPPTPRCRSWHLFVKLNLIWFCGSICSTVSWLSFFSHLKAWSTPARWSNVFMTFKFKKVIFKIRIVFFQICILQTSWVIPNQIKTKVNLRKILPYEDLVHSIRYVLGPVHEPSQLKTLWMAWSWVCYTRGKVCSWVVSQPLLEWEFTRSIFVRATCCAASTT